MPFSTGHQLTLSKLFNFIFFIMSSQVVKMFAEALSVTGRKIEATSLFHYQKSPNRKATN